MLADDLLSGADAAARYLGVNRRAIYGMTTAGQLPVVRVGRKLFFRKSELDRAFSADQAA